ncbi:MAG: hypothetical protein JWM11_2342 [Planctomycetaceae bacterium]|nr:hypothetical protein [Planctomycetaceae bacterium]
MDADEQLLNARFTFRVRPIPVPSSLRPVRRISFLVLLFNQCFGHKSTMLQLQVLNWAIRNTENRAQFTRFLEGPILPGEVVVRFDPSLTRAVEFALAENLIEPAAGKAESTDVPAALPLQLAEKGKAMVARLNKYEDIFVIEKQFLNSLGGKLTRNTIDALFPKE